MNARTILCWVLRLVGFFALLAVFAVVMPFAWMDEVHRWLGLGSLPKIPVVEYLARSASAFYALLGGLLWVLSRDVERFRPVLIYIGAAIVIFGLTLLVVDWRAGLPWWWVLWEGTVNLGYGALILILSLCLRVTIGNEGGLAESEQTEEARRRVR